MQRAARILRISRSALGRQVERLEEELDVELLVRGSRGVTLTPAGRELASNAPELLRDASQLFERVRAASDQARGVLRFIVPAGMPVGPRARALVALRSAQPDLDVEVIEDEDPVSRLGEPFDLLRTARRVASLLDAHFEDVDAVSSFSEGALDSLMAKSVHIGRAPPGSGYSPRETNTAAHQEGFSLHCGVRIHENDQQGLEQLLAKAWKRYGGRGPLAQSRLTETDDGSYAYRLRRPMPDGRGSLVLTGNVDVLECASCGRARVVALIKDGVSAAKILRHRGLDSSVPECAPATGPPQLDLPLAA